MVVKLFCGINLFAIFSVAIALSLSGCVSRADHTAFIEGWAQRLNARAEVVAGSEFSLQTFQIMSGRGHILRVYIEGDGKAWSRRNRPSFDPTPVFPLVLNLVLADNSVDKVYIARPCQYVMDKNCNIGVWTDQRYSQLAVNNLNDILDILKKKGRYKEFELIAYSGGATLALLVAAERTDINSVRTIAGNLAPDFLNRWHNVSPMPEAMNPIKLAEKLENVPQIHFSGADDTVVPPDVYSAYRAAFRSKNCIEGKTFAEVDHQKGWIKYWSNILMIAMPTCAG